MYQNFHEFSATPRSIVAEPIRSAVLPHRTQITEHSASNQLSFYRYSELFPVFHVI